MGEGYFDGLPAPARVVIVQNARPLLFELSVSAERFTCEDARLIRAPTLLINGERTAPLFKRIGARLAECIPGSESLVVPAASHAAYRQNPEAFNRGVLDFLSRHDD